MVLGFSLKYLCTHVTKNWEDFLRKSHRNLLYFSTLYVSAALTPLSFFSISLSPLAFIPLAHDFPCSDPDQLPRVILELLTEAWHPPLPSEP